MNKSKKKTKQILTESEKKQAAIDAERRRNTDTLGEFDSVSEPGTTHKVEHVKGTGEITCTCKGFQFKAECRHVKTVLGQNVGGIRMTLEKERSAIKSKDKGYARLYGG